MRKDESVYHALYECLEKQASSFDTVYKYIVKETGKDIKPNSLRTILYRQSDKGIIVNENGLYSMKKSRNDGMTMNDKHEMFKTYIDEMLNLTMKYEKKLAANPFESFHEDGKLLEAKKVYFFNKQIQNILKKKLQEMM